MFFVSIAIVITAFNYFIDVFIERSLVAGGAQGCWIYPAKFGDSIRAGLRYDAPNNGCGYNLYNLCVALVFHSGCIHVKPDYS